MIKFKDILKEITVNQPGRKQIIVNKIGRNNWTIANDEKENKWMENYRLIWGLPKVCFITNEHLFFSIDGEDNKLLDDLDKHKIPHKEEGRYTHVPLKYVKIIDKTL